MSLILKVRDYTPWLILDSEKMPVFHWVFSKFWFSNQLSLELNWMIWTFLKLFTYLKWFSGRLGLVGRMRSVLMMAADSLLKGLNKVYSLLNRETQVQGWFDFDHRIPTEKQQRTLKITCFSPIQHTGPFASKPIGSQKVFFTFRFKFLPLVCLSSTSHGYHSATYILY